MGNAETQSTSCFHLVLHHQQTKVRQTFALRPVEQLISAAVHNGSFPKNNIPNVVYKVFTEASSFIHTSVGRGHAHCSKMTVPIIFTELTIALT